MTSNISTQPPNNKDKAIGNTFGQECLQIPIPVPKHERYIWPDTLNMSPLQTYPMIQTWEIEILLPNPEYQV